MLKSQRLPLEWRLRLSLFCLLLGIYLLVYSPLINSADGEALLNVSVSTVRHGLPDIGVMGASEALLPFEMSRMGSFGLDGVYYSKKGPTPSLILLPLVSAAEIAPWLDIRATAMLLNPLVTALTAVLLYTLARWSGYRSRTAYVVALLYGVATFAITYVKTLFGEPLAALLLLSAVLAAYQYHLRGNRRTLAAAGACIGLMAGVNLVYITLLPVLALFLFWPSIRTVKASMWHLLKDAAAFLLPIFAFLLLLGLYNWARFSSPLNTGYHFGSGEGFNRPLLEGLFGLTIAPYRGLFWYSPLLLLAIPGWLMLRRAAPWLAWLALALIAAGIFLFASWWSWDGGITWGPRFLLTITPLAAFCLTPLIDAAWRRWRIALPLIGFTLLSIGVQFLGAAYSIYPFISYLWEHYYDYAASRLFSEVMVNPGLSAIMGHLALAVERWPLEPAWIANGVDGVHVLVALALVTVGIFFTVEQLWRPPKRSRLMAVLTLIGIIFSLNIVVARQQHGETFETVRALENTLQPPGTVLVTSTLFGESLADVEGDSWLLSTNAPTAPDDLITRQMTDFAVGRDGNLWLVTWFSPADPANWQERELWANAAFAYERAVPGHRALLFNTTPTEPSDLEVGARFGPIQLDSYGITRLPEGLIITVEWSAVEQPAGDYSWFIHVLAADGTILAQGDRQPQGGYSPTSSWTLGQQVTDRLYFPGLTAADLSLRIGFIDSITGEHLSTVDSDGSLLADGYIILPLAN